MDQETIQKITLTIQNKKYLLRYRNSEYFRTRQREEKNAHLYLMKKNKLTNINTDYISKQDLFHFIYDDLQLYFYMLDHLPLQSFQIFRDFVDVEDYYL